MLLQQAGPSKPLPAAKPEAGVASTSTDPEASMSSPKAGMFAVASRQWTKSPKKKASKPATGWNSSDSDYVESEDEEKDSSKPEV